MWYFDNELMYTIAQNEIIWVLEKVHPYLVCGLLLHILTHTCGLFVFHRRHTGIPCRNSSCWILIMALHFEAKLIGLCAASLKTNMTPNRTSGC